MAENVTKFQTFDGVEHDIEDSTARTGLENVYTKSEADALLAGKVDTDEVYSKAVLNAILDSKADEDNVYSKTATDDLLSAKANAADVYTKTEADAALALKADAADVYTKTEADNLLSAKANSADVYTITQSDNLLSAKASIDNTSITSTVATWSTDKLNIEFQGKADGSDVYTKAEVDALLEGLGMGILDFANAVLLTTTEYITASKGAVLGGLHGSSQTMLLIDGVKYNSYDTDARCPFIAIYGIDAGVSLRITTNDDPTYGGLHFIPYK